MIPPDMARSIAATYRELGWSVVPLGVGRKKLSLRKGELAQYRSRLANLAEIESWWPRKSQRNIGILCGSASGGLLVRDFDDGKDYTAWARENPAMAEQLPTVKTRRGFHVYLMDTEGFVGSLDLRRFDAEGEIKGDGTYVVGAGSVVRFGADGSAIEPFKYCWTNHTHLSTISLATSGLVPRAALDSVRGAEGPIGRVGSPGSKGGLGTPRIRVGVSEQLSEVEFLLDKYSIDGAGQRRNALKSLAMEFISKAGNERPS